MLLVVFIVVLTLLNGAVAAECDRYEYRQNGTDICIPCGENMVSTKNETSCTCLVGYFHNQFNVETCYPCPIGGVCAGGDEEPTAQPGYWVGTGGYYPERCPLPQACRGGLARCADGYQGRLCAACAPGFYRLYGSCHMCPRAISWIFWVFLVIVLVVTVLLTMALASSRYVALVKMAAFFFQFVHMFVRTEVGDTGIIRRAMIPFSSLFMFDLDLLAPQCVFPGWSYASRWWFAVFVPPILLAIFAAAFVVQKRRLAQSHDHAEAVARLRKRYFNAFMLALTLGYLPLTLTTLQPAGCKFTELMQSVVYSEPELFCDTRAFYRMLAGVVIFGLIYSLGIPAGISGWLFSQRAKIASQEFRAGLPWLFEGYGATMKTSLWELRFFAEKLAIALVSVFMISFMAWQVFLFAIIIFLAITHTLMYRPFKWSRDNTLFVRLWWILLLLLGLTAIRKVTTYRTANFLDFSTVALLALASGLMIAQAVLHWKRPLAEPQSNEGFQLVQPIVAAAYDNSRGEETL